MKRLAQTDCILLALTAIASLVLAFGLPLITGYRALRYGGFYGMALMLVLFCAIALVFWARYRKTLPAAPRKFWLGASVLLIYQVILLLLTPDAFRVMEDEAILLNTALSLHEEKELFAASEGYWVDGEFEIVAGALDKRPFFYVFLLSLVHDGLGYRVENAFLLNAGLSLLAGLLGLRLFAVACGVWPSLVAMLALVPSPAFLAAANSAGFEMLNFVLLALLALAVRFFIRCKDSFSALPLCCLAILLAYARYESILFVLPVGAILVYHRFGSDGRPWHPAVALMPFLLVPYVWLYRCTLARGGAWARAEAESLPVFSLTYLPERVIDAFRYFFFSEELSEKNALLIYGGTLGLAWLIFLALRQLLRRDFKRADQSHHEWAFWFGAYLILTAVLMTYFWSSFMDVMSQRMALPYFWALAGGFAFLISRWCHGGSQSSAIRLLILAGVSLVFSPGHIASVQHRLDQNSLARLQTEKWLWHQRAEVPREGVLFIDNNPAIWTALRYSALKWQAAADGRIDIFKAPDLPDLDIYYGVQVSNRASPDDSWHLARNQQLTEFVAGSEPEWSVALTSQTKVTMSRLKRLPAK